jgi:hypothetical protein
VEHMADGSGLTPNCAESRHTSCPGGAEQSPRTEYSGSQLAVIPCAGPMRPTPRTQLHPVCLLVGLSCGHSWPCIFLLFLDLLLNDFHK